MLTYYFLLRVLEEDEQATECVGTQLCQHVLFIVENAENFFDAPTAPQQYA